MAAKHFHMSEFAGKKGIFGKSVKSMDLLKKYGLHVPNTVAATGKAIVRK